MIFITTIDKSKVGSIDKGLEIEFTYKDGRVRRGVVENGVNPNTITIHNSEKGFRAYKREYITNLGFIL